MPPNSRSDDSLPVALTIAGLDPSGGAGIIEDILTFAAFGCFPTSAVTAVTFQNTKGIFGATHQLAETVSAQVRAIIDDFQIASAKTGMLPTREVVVEVARLFGETSLPSPVVDPVIRSTSGYDLMDEAAIEALVSDLIPRARVVTPNIPEAERLTGIRIADEAGMRLAARKIREMGTRAVLVKGGHLRRDEGGSRRKVESPGTQASRPQLELTNRAGETPALSGGIGEAIDLLDDEGQVTVFRSPWLDVGETHGTGCTLSAAIAACLGRGMSLESSVREAKRFVTHAIGHAPDLGHGARPLFPRGRSLKVC